MSDLVLQPVGPRTFSAVSVTRFRVERSSDPGEYTFSLHADNRMHVTQDECQGDRRPSDR